MAWIGAVVGGIVSAAGSSSSSSRQKKGAREAQALSDRQYQQTVERNAPFYTAGVTAQERLNERLPELTNNTYDPARLAADPAFQWAQAQGLEGIQSTAAARGGLYSGNALKELTRYAQGNATQYLDNAYNRQLRGNQQTYNMLSGVADRGQASANLTATLGAQNASQAGENVWRAADASSANTLAQGQIWGNLAGGLINAYNNREQRASVTQGSDPEGFAGTQNNRSAYVAPSYADGGPVRREPVVGSRTPLPSGGGGGLSPAAIRAVIVRAYNESAPQPVPLPGTLLVNPLNPRAVNAERERQAGMAYGGAVRDMKRGGAVPGKSAGRADDVRARLSAGEHVIDAETVALLGQGNTEAGHALLEDMAQRVRATRS